MLVLERKLNEAIVLDGNSKITVLEVRGNRVKLGIEGPVEAWREERIPGLPPEVHSDPLDAELVAS